MLLLGSTMLLFAAVATDFLSPRIGLRSETIELAQVYWDCVLSTSSDFEVSAEASDVIAKAAFSACEEEKTKFVGSYVADVIIASSQDNEETKRALTQFDDALMARAIEALVIIRAEKNRRAQD